MKKTILGFIGILFAVTSFAQTDSSGMQNNPQKDSSQMQVKMTPFALEA